MKMNDLLGLEGGRQPNVKFNNTISNWLGS